MNSLRARLLAWLLPPLLLLLCGTGLLIWLLAWLPAAAAFDQLLFERAALLAACVEPGPDGPLLRLPSALAGVATEGGTYVVRTGSTVLAGDPSLPLPARGSTPVQEARWHGGPVRVAVLEREVGGQTVRVAFARSLGQRPALRSGLLPVLALAGVAAAGLVLAAAGGVLAPLARLRSSLAVRGPDPAALGEKDWPAEMRPLVQALDEQLARARAGAEAHQAFLANVAHQLRTPLAGLGVQLDWLLARHAQDPASRASLELMRSATERMARQSNQLLALARAEPSRAVSRRRDPLDLAELVGESVQVFVQAAAARGLDLGYELAPTRLQGDRFLLRDLVENLIDNALRYTPSGGQVTVRCAPAADGGAVFVVDDSGPGIAPAEREHVFLRHVRLERNAPGSGLGLAIVRESARAHGAAVTIETSPAGGARFCVRFPPV